MENIYEFIFRSSIAIGLFYLVYWIFLRQSTHFKANRLFLLSALIISLLISIFPIQYDVMLGAQPKQQLFELGKNVKNLNALDGFVFDEDRNISVQTIFHIIYLLGVTIFSSRLLIQSLKPIRIILKNKTQKKDKRLIIENNIFDFPFSFFNYIFINPTHHKQEELDDILAHENVHIHERHWVDLLIIELLTVLFWFNPFIWFFEHSIKQNHEYLADEGVLSRGQTPVRYQALLVNQLMGMKVIGLSNSLNFALGPNRLKMMTKQKTSKSKLARLAWGLPVLAVLLLAFAQPNYQYHTEQPENELIVNNTQNIESDKEITLQGIVQDESGDPLPGASVLVKGTAIGSVTDRQGKFTINIAKKGTIALVASFVGMETTENEVNISDNEKVLDYKFAMKKAVIGISNDFSDEMPPPPPPPPAVEVDNSEDAFYIVEEMPQHPQGHYGLGQYVKYQTKELKQKLFFEGKKLKGKATVGFTVNTKGEVTNVHILDKTTDIAAKTAATIISNMKKWSPGKQRGKPVSVDFAIELEF